MMLFFRIYKFKILFIATGCILVAAMVTLGGLVGFTKINAYMEIVHHGNTEPISELSIIRTSMMDSRRTLWRVLALQDPSESEAGLGLIQHNVVQVDEAWSRYDPRGISSDKEAEIAAALRERLPHFKEVIDKTNELVGRKDYEAAILWLDSSIPFLDKVDDLISENIATNKAQATDLMKRSAEIFNVIFITSLTIIGFGVCAIGWIVFYLVRQRDNAINDSRYNLWLANEVVANAENGMLVTDARGAIQKANPAFTRLTGYTQAEVLGRNPSMLTSKRQSPEFYRDFWRSLAEKGEWKGELWNRRKDGALYLQSLSVTSIRARDGKISHYVGIFSDITEHELAKERLSYLATHDALTDLPNRALFNERLGQAIARAKRGLWQVAVMFLDLDRFKSINDTLGHKIGDGVLITVARRLKQTLRETDTVARLGGDEFVVILEDVTEIAHITSVAQALLQSVGQTIDIDGCSVSTTPSIGVSLYPVDGEDAKLLVERADLAMYEAKRAGKNTFRFFESADSDTLCHAERGIG